MTSEESKALKPGARFQLIVYPRDVSWTVVQVAATFIEADPWRGAEVAMNYPRVFDLDGLRRYEQVSE